MTWRIWLRPWDSGQLSNTDIFQPVTFKRNMMLLAARTWIFGISDPTFTSLNMKIYSDENDTPKKLLATSTNSPLKSEIFTTYGNGIKEIFFEFNNFNVQSETLYNIVINGIGYSPTSSSFLGWRKAYPDPIYRAGYTPTKENLGVAPYEISFVGTDL